MKLSERFKSVNEASQVDFKELEDKLKGVNLVDMRKPLEKMFNKKDIDFTFSPVPHFRIKVGGKTLIIVNKKYADKSEIEFDSVAIGFDGDI